MKRLINRIRKSAKAKSIMAYFILAFFGIYVFSTPYFSDRKPFNYLVYAIFAIFAFLVIAYKILFLDIKRIDYRIFFFVAFAAFASIGTILYSQQFRYLLSVTLISLSFVVIFLMLGEIGNNELIIKIIIYALSLFSLLFIIHYRNDLISVSNWGKNRLASDNYFDNVNGVAYYFSLCLVFSLYYVVFGKKKTRFIFLIPFVACLFLGTLTASRTFLVGSIVCSILIFVIKFRKKPLILLIGFGIAILFIILFFAIPAFKTIRDRFTSMFNMITGNAYSTDYSTATRILWQDYATYLGLHHILIGNGVNGFAVYSGTGTYSHANIPELLCDTGLIGVVLYYFTPMLAVKDVFTKKTKSKSLVVILFAFLISREFLDITYYSKLNALIFAIMSYSGSLGESIVFKKKEDSTQYYCLEI